MRHHSLFSDKSDLYARARPTYPPEIFKFISDLCASNTRVWDCACGNGQASIDLARHFDQVHATDISKQQIDNAKGHPKIHYSVCQAEASLFLDNTFDAVCVAQALHWFDFDLFWPEVKRVLKPGGVFTAWCYNFMSAEPELDQLINGLIAEVIKPYWAPQNQLSWNHYKDLEFPFKKIKAPNFEMHVYLNFDQYFELIHTWSATRRCMDDIGDGFFKHAYHQARKVWGNTQDAKRIDLDFFFYAGMNT